MDKATVDALLIGMIQSADHVSDLVFIEGKAPLVESHGRLQEFPIDTPGSVLTCEIVEAMADCMMSGNARLLTMYAGSGSCDTSYEVPGLARFRVNIYKHNGGGGRLTAGGVSLHST